MEIIHFKKIETAQLPEGSKADTYFLCVGIGDAKIHAESLINTLKDTSWIEKLDNTTKRSYRKTALKTIEKLVEIFKSVDGKIKEDFGQYMVSMSAGEGLKQQYGHKVLPISEIWKDRIIGNSGFDFHTESPEARICFGEAKYSSSKNSYSASAKQIVDFINDEKDLGDGIHLKHLASPTAQLNLDLNTRGFIVAFSIHSNNYELILKNTLEHTKVKEILKIADELYIVGISS